MKTGDKHITALLALLLLSTVTAAQVNVRTTVNSDSILIGEPITVTVEAYMPTGARIEWFVADSFPHFLITSRSPIDTVQNIDAKKVSQEFSVTSFDSGYWQLPPFEIVIDQQAFYTDSVGINVGYTPFDPSEDYRDIKTIIEVSNPAVNKIPLYLTLAVLASLGVLMSYLRKRRKPEAVVAQPVIPELSPYEEAVRALKALARKGSSDVKFYYSELNDILRNYVWRRHNISSFERTNEELILQLSKLDMPKDSFIALAQALRMADFVKFAKYRPSSEENESNFGVIRASIDVMDKRVVSAV